MQLYRKDLILMLLLVLLQIHEAAAWTLHSHAAAVTSSSQQIHLQSKSRHFTRDFCLHMNNNNIYTDNVNEKKPAARKKSLFAQPAYTQQQQSQLTETTSSSFTPRIHKIKKPFQSDSTMMSLHQERLQTAGRIGTKRFVNPCKLFIGNLAFDTTEADLQHLLQESLGAHLPSYLWLHRLHIVRDWKTSKSKGYAFCDFTEPHFATVCLMKCHNMELQGRQLVVKQGVKQLKQNEVYVKKTKREPLTDEEAAIQAGLAQAEEEELMVLDPEQVSMLRRLDPDLLPDYLRVDSSSSSGVKLKQLQKEQRKEQRVQESMLTMPAATVRDQDFNDDEDYYENNEDLYELDIDDDDDDDDDFEFDGDYDEEVGEFDDSGAPDSHLDSDQPMNREQRRQAAKAVKRRKKPAKGFGK